MQKIKQTTQKHQDVFSKRKTRSPKRKNLFADHPSENSSRMNICSTWMTINPPSLYLPVYLSPPISKQQLTSLSLFFIQLTKSPPLRHQRKAPKDLDLDMASQVSIDIHSLTRSPFMDKDSVYRISINTMNEMEKRGRIFGFSQGKKLSLFIHLRGFSLLSLFFGFQGLFNPYRNPLATPHSCVCIYASRYAMDNCNAEYRDHATCDQVVPYGHMVVASCTLQSHPKRLPHGSRGNLGRLLVSISLVNASSKLDGKAQVLYPKLHKSPGKIHQT